MARIRKLFNLEIAEIVNGCKKNEESYQRLLFERYAPSIYTVCRRYGSSYYDAKDLLQDTFIKIFEKIHQFDSTKGKLENWMTRIAINLAINAIRDRKLKLVSLDFDIEEPNEKYEFSDNLTEEKILAIVNKLPLGYKTIFNLYVIDGYSHQDIASKLNISLSTSKSQLFKAKRVLQKQIVTIQKSNYGGL